MKKTFIVLLLSNWLLMPFAYSSDSLERLASIRDLAFGGIGVAGITSQRELAFRDILGRSTAENDFLTLLDSGNAQARCYALVALRSINPKI
jgi:hypothetical protein